MPLTTLRKVWLAVSIASFLFALNIMVATQGWPEFLSIDNFIEVGLPDDVTEPLAAYWGIIFLTALLIISFWLILLHAREARGQKEARWPGRLMDFDPDRQPGRVVTLVTGLFFGAFPLYTLGHAWRVFHDSVVLCQNIDGIWSEVARGWRAPWHLPDTFTWQALLFGDQLRFGGGCAAVDIALSATAFPVLMPIVLLAGLLLLVILVGQSLFAIFRR